MHFYVYECVIINAVTYRWNYHVLAIMIRNNDKNDQSFVNHSSFLRTEQLESDICCDWSLLIFLFQQSAKKLLFSSVLVTHMLLHDVYCYLKMTFDLKRVNNGSFTIGIGIWVVFEISCSSAALKDRLIDVLSVY